jgi:uncharacterized protein
MRTLRIPVLLLLTLLVGQSLFAQPAVPVLQQRVTDFTNSLSFNEWKELESRLQRFEDSTSTQVAILLINSLEGASIDDYSMQVFEKNKIGQKGKDNGVLILVAKEDRKARIDVGYGLEGVLTDAVTSQIREREMNPYFKAGNFYGGLSAGVTAIMATTAGEYKVDSHGRNAPLMTIIMALFFFGFLGAFVFPALAGKRRYVIRSGGSRYQSGWGWPYGGFGGGGFGGGSFGGGGGWSGGGGMAGGGGSSGSW